MKNKISPPLMGTVKYKEGSDFRKVINESLNVFFKDALRVALTNPLQAYSFLRTVKWQKKAARLRSDWEQRGIHVPPIMILSITNRCNLHCTGCYNQALRQLSQAEMSEDKLRSIIAEGKELGISFMVLAGGEPFIRPEIMGITKDFPEIIFLVFTNGLLLDDDLLAKLRRQRNLVPAISIEGYVEETDERRGKGVYEQLQGIMKKIRSYGIFWSVSITVTRSNFDTVTDYQFIRDLTSLGCKLFFFVEYTPINEETESWLITDEQRTDLYTLRDSFRSEFQALFVAVPGDEEEIGGCLAAGRGFVHINAEGNVEPCPFVPYSDTNLKDLSLKEALQSEFLKIIRQNRERLSETEGGCALWAEREWLGSLLHKQ